MKSGRLDPPEAGVPEPKFGDGLLIGGVLGCSIGVAAVHAVLYFFP